MTPQSNSAAHRRALRTELMQTRVSSESGLDAAKHGSIHGNTSPAGFAVGFIMFDIETLKLVGEQATMLRTIGKAALRACALMVRFSEEAHCLNVLQIRRLIPFTFETTPIPL